MPAPPSAPPSATASASAAIEDNNSEANSTMTSYSSVTRDYSLPSSFAGDEGNRSSGEVCAEHKLSMTSLISSTNRSQTGQQKQQQQKQQEEEMSQLMDDPNRESSTDRAGDMMEGKENDDDGDDADSKDQLAVQISKETQPMMHLIRLLKEMDDGKGNYHAGSADPRGKALASLIHDFENEVSLIEHRVKDEYLIMNGEQPPPQEEEEDEEPLSPLPPNWIALEDPGSGDVYYANEATGE